MAEKLWGGRFTKAIAPEFERFSESFSYDHRLALAEVRGSRAHVGALQRAGIVSEQEAGALREGLQRLEAELRGPASPLNGNGPLPELEDVHTWVAQRLEQLAGPAARKLQTGRSRNEQVALDLRLYLIDHKEQLFALLARLLGNLGRFAETYAEVLIPGYTHLQRAQPVSLGHHALAYAEMLLRDTARLRDAYSRVEVLPLGSGALAGSTLNLDRELLAKELGFTKLSQNSLDAVSDRDFACELTFVFALLGVHLSRFAEDWILYSSAEFNFLLMGDEYATGSSLMPQKKNADALELIRGKSARQVGNLTRLLTLLKGLPMAYNRDLQEDKEAMFDALQTVLGVLRIAAGVVETTQVRADRAARAADDPALLATDLADLLVENGVAFRDAHEIVGHVISKCVAEERDFRAFSTAEWAEIAPGFLSPERAAALTAAISVGRRNSLGGTSIEQVRAQARRIVEVATRL